MKKEIKYYMNAPCEIIRKICEDFSEVKIYPEFRDDLEGHQWCSECMVGNNGTPQRHTCEEYWDVINALSEIENSILCVVENRLIADEPVEFKQIKSLSKKIEDLNKSIIEKANALVEFERTISDKVGISNLTSKTIEKQDEVILIKQKEIEDLNYKISNLSNKYIYSSPKELNISQEDISYLNKRDFILTSLENGGVKNWEWYSESYPSHEDLIAKGY